MTAKIIITNKAAEVMMMIVTVKFLVFLLSSATMSAVEFEVVVSIDAVVVSTCASGFCIFKDVCFLVFGSEVLSFLGFVDAVVLFAVVVGTVVVVAIVAVVFVNAVVPFIVVVFFVVAGAIVLFCVVLKFNCSKSYGSKTENQTFLFDNFAIISKIVINEKLIL